MGDAINILLVDDDERNLVVLETILNSPDYHLIKASTADQALLALMDHDCAAIVMDVKMPDMSGIELAQLIKRRRKTQHIPILFLSAHYYEEEHVVLGYGVGAVDYITKPVNPAILRSKISVFVELFRKTSELARLNQAMEATNQELAIKNAELERSAEDRAQRIRAEAARAEAEAANQAKDRFLAMLSHELRTPLSPVIHAVSLIEEEVAPTPVLSELLDTIRRNVQLEARLIDDLLDLARIRNGKLQLHPENVDVHNLVRRALEVCAPEAGARDIEVRLDLQACRPEMVGDGPRIQQIIYNLLGNAIKYTGAGGHVRLITRDDPHTRRLQVRVEDSGIGIAPEKIGKIFDAFEQVHGDRSTGLGLGLAICRVLAELHGGTIVAESRGPGQGSAFTVSLPARDHVTAPILPESQPVKGGSIPLRLLLVEDHLDTANNLKRLLIRRGYEVSLATTVASAASAMREGTFDVLISDIGLPDGQGLELMEPFIEVAGPRTVAGIALSGFGMAEDVERSHGVGFSYHLTKPVDISELERCLAALAPRLSATSAASITR